MSGGGGIIGGIIGAAIGFFVGGPMGAVKGFAIGSAIGGALLPPDGPTQYGPRLDDLKAQASEYGAPIPIVYGTAALQGTVIWAADLKEVENETGGGKGEPTQVSYDYYGTFAVLLCEGPVQSIGRIWAGPSKRLIWDGMRLESGSLRVYLGDEDQLPDPTIEAAVGVGNAPAYRGWTYIVLEDFLLKNDGNMLPFLTVEVGASATCPLPVQQPSGLYMTDPAPEFVAGEAYREQIFYDAKTGKLYWTRKDGGAWFLDRFDFTTRAVDSLAFPGHEGRDVNIAWDNNGFAEYIYQNTSKHGRVDLEEWALGFESYVQEDFPESDGTVTRMHIAMSDIVHTGGGVFRMLSYSNSVNTFGESAGSAFGIYPIPDEYTWESFGARAGGTLTPMDYYGAAASFQHQPSNYAPQAVWWDVFVGGEHNFLFSFSEPAYSYLDGGFTEMSNDFGQVRSPVYDPETDRVYAWTSEGVVAFDPAKLTPTAWPRDDCVYYADNVPQAYGDGETGISLGFGRLLAVMPGGRLAAASYPSGDVFIIDARGAVSPNGIALSAVVADLSERAGETRYNVAALAGDTVDGYVIARPIQVRGAIDVLRAAYYFDAVESQGVIRFVKRGGAVAAVIDDADLGARDAGSDGPDPLQTTRRMEFELPRAVTIKYMLAATDYTPATKHARRLVGSSGDERTLEVPLVLSDQKAQEVAEVNLHSAWVERLSYSFTLPRKYSYLEPTDLVLVKGHLMRLTTMKATPRGVLECEALADDSEYYAPHVVVTETPPNDKTVSKPGQSFAELF